jgi:hypothetical protein
MKKTWIIVVTVLLVIGLFLSLAISCSQRREGPPIKEVRVENKSGYVFKKIYIEDKRGFTHEILTATSGNTLGGVSMIELCVYKE